MYEGGSPPPLVLSGHAASLTPYYSDTPRGGRSDLTDVRGVVEVEAEGARHRAGQHRPRDGQHGGALRGEGRGVSD